MGHIRSVGYSHSWNIGVNGRAISVSAYAKIALVTYSTFLSLACTRSPLHIVECFLSVCIRLPGWSSRTNSMQEQDTHSCLSASKQS